MPAAMTALRDGLAAQLDTIPKLRVSTTLPEDPNPPVAVVMLERVVFDSTFGRGSDQVDFRVRVIVGRTTERTAQGRLDTYLAGSGSSSVKAAIEADPTLGGAALAVTVTEASDIGDYVQAGAAFLTVDFLVTVYA